MAPQDQRVGIPPESTYMTLGSCLGQASRLAELAVGSPGSMGQFLCPREVPGQRHPGLSRR